MPVYKTTELERITIEPVRLTLSSGKKVPLIIDDWTLSFRLGFTGKTLWYIAKNRDKLYKTFMLKKKSGGLRRTFDPTPMMRIFQKQLRAKILLPLCEDLGPHVAAYQLGKSTVDAARAHLRECQICDDTTKPGTNPVKHECKRRGVKFKMDLRDFFLSTTRAMIRSYFHEVVGYNHYASSLLGQLLTTTYVDDKKRKRNGVPPGALTAGDICNLVANRTIDLPMLAALPGWRYTRYADDLYFSHDEALPPEQVKEAIKTAAEVIKSSGYRVNWKKLQVQRWQRPQRVLGVNINRKLNIPKSEYARMHNLLYHAHKYGFRRQLEWAKKDSVEELHHWIAGKLNYFKQFAPEKTAKLKKLYDAAKIKYANEPLETEASEFVFVRGKLVEPEASSGVVEG